MLNEHPRQQLQIIITQFGHSICDNPKRCEAILRDYCPEYKREVNLLIAALKEKIAYDLLNTPALMPLEATLKSLSQRLQDNHGTAEDFADWAVESWALSLSVMKQPLPKQAIKPATNTSSIQTKTVTSSSPQQQRIGKFVVRGGIALDTETNLIWCRFAYGQTWKNDTAVGDAKEVSFAQAIEVEKQINKHGGYAGYNDWRLPTIDELKTLLDKIKGKNKNYIDTDVFPNNPNWAWSSSPYTNDSNYAYFVYFYHGYDSNGNKDSCGAVRLVRNKTVAVAVKPPPQTPKVAVTSLSAPVKIISPLPLASTLQHNLGSIGSNSGKLDFTFEVSNGHANMRIYAFDPSDMRKSGVFFRLDEARYQTLKELVLKTEETIEKLKQTGQMRKLQISYSNDASVEINLGSVTSYSGSLYFSVVVDNKENGYFRLFACDPTNMRKSGILLFCNDSDLLKLKDLIIKTNDIINNL